MAQRLEIVASGLLPAEMGVDAHVPGSSRERLAFPVGDVLLRLGITVLLSHAEIDDVNHVRSLCPGSSNQEIVGLDISVNQVLLVDRLDTRQLWRWSVNDVFNRPQRGSTHHLLRNHADCLEAEPPVAVIKEILQRWAKQIDDQDVVKAFLTEVVDIGNAGCARTWLDKMWSFRGDDFKGLTAANQDFVCPVLVAKLGSVALPGFLYRKHLVSLAGLQSAVPRVVANDVQT